MIVRRYDSDGNITSWKERLKKAAEGASEMGHITSYKGDLEKAIEWYKLSLKLDSSYTIASFWSERGDRYKLRMLSKIVALKRRGIKS